MSTKVYGAPLPPGLDATTRGELRLRIDKLLLDNIALNRNPLVHFHFGNNDGSVGAEARQGSGGSSISPNKFVVPVDYCAVSPLFWGEPRPSAYCQPATPGQTARGAVTLVYPIKSSQENFADYLAGMSRSPHGGLQMAVYVPSSYSGRPAVPVGKSVVMLDELASGKAIAGWFSVVHSQPSDEADADEDGDGFQYFTVGKIKVHVQVDFFPTSFSSTPPAAARPLAQRGAERPRSGGHAADTSGNASRDDAAVAATPRRRAGRGVRPAGMNVSFKSDSDSARNGARHAESIEVDMTGIETADDDEPSAEERSAVQRSAQKAMAPSTSTSAVATAARQTDRVRRSSTTVSDPLEEALRRQDMNVEVGDIVSRGLQLRERLAKAFDVPGEPINATSNGELNLDKRGHSVRAARRPIAEDADDDDTVYSSEESDEEQFALQLQREQRLRALKEKEGALSSCIASIPRAAATPHGEHASSMAAAHTAPTSGANVSNNGRWRTTQQSHSEQPIRVQLRFSDFTFSATPMTQNLTEMRINVRLSEDITTGEPTTGPFSSYVHQVPLSQGSICLSFSIRSFSEEVSRLVVELIKVRSTVVKEGGAAATSAAHRQVISEEPLGLSIVGVYGQKRQLALRDPVTNSTNAYCQMTMSLSGGAFGEAKQTEPRRDGRGVDATAASDGTRQHGPRHTSVSSATRSSSSSSSTASSSTPMRQRKGASVADTSREQPSPASTATESDRDDGRAAARRGRRHIRRHRSTRARDGSRQRRHRTPPDARDSPLSTSSSSLSPSLSRRAVRIPGGSPLPATRPARVESVRLCIAIQRAVQLPRVLVTPGSTGQALLSGKRSSAVGGVSDAEGDTTAEPVAQHADDVADQDGYVAPRAFFLVDRLLAPATSSRHPQQSSGAEVEGWTVDSYANGFYDRTHVASPSQKPIFNYSCVLALPPLPITLPAADDEGDCTHSEQLAPRSSVFGHALGELRLSLWHCAEAAVANPSQPHDKAPQSTERQEGGEKTEAEVQFWSASARLGECVVDLKPLRYLSRLDGFYRVSSQLPLFALEETCGGGRTQSSSVHVSRLSSAVPDHGAATIGHVHVSVWLAE